MNTTKKHYTIMIEIKQECLFIIGEHLFTSKRFLEDMNQIKQYFQVKFNNLDKDSLFDLYFSYLYIYEYSIESIQREGDFLFVQVKAKLPDLGRPYALAIFVPEQKKVKWGSIPSLVQQYPKYSFLIIFSLSDIPSHIIKIDPQTLIIDREKLLKTFAGLVLNDYFDRYILTLSSLPNSRAFVFQTIEEQLKLKFDDLQYLRERLSSILKDNNT